MATRLIRNGLTLGLVLSHFSSLGCNKRVKWLKDTELLTLRKNMKEKCQLLLLVKRGPCVSAFTPDVFALTMAGLENNKNATLAKRSPAWEEIPDQL